MIADRLRTAILQAAISGKLTDQRPEDGTAAELLEQIAAERAQLVKEKKVKKQKPLPQVVENERPFALPETWAWVRLGEAILLLSGRDLTPEQYSDRPTGIPYITGASNFTNGSLTITRWTEKPLTLAREGDLLITCKGTIGALAVLQEPEAHIARQVMSITCLQISRDYVAAFLEYSVSALKAQAKSMIPGISRDMLLLTALPLPPVAEQERIVAKLDDVLPLIDQLAELEREKKHLDREFAVAVERAILQAAISGKLTKQHPEDGTAFELLQQIAQERQKLEKEGKIKKQKPLPQVDRAEASFDIPDSWEWCELRDVVQLINGDRGKNYPSKNKLTSDSSSGLPFISAINLIDGKIGEAGLLFLTQEQYDVLGSGKFQKNDIIFCLRGSLGKKAISQLEHGAIASSLVILRRYTEYPLLSYVSLYIDSPLLLSEIRLYGNGTAQPNLSANSLARFRMPLPPLKEQERIVAKLDETLSLVQGIKELVS